MADVEDFFKEAMKDGLETVHAIAVSPNNRTHKFEPFRIAEHQENGNIVWDFFGDFLGDWSSKANRLVLDGRGVKGIRVLYRTIYAPVEETDSAAALVNALERTSVAMVGMVEQAVASQRALTAAVTTANESSVAAIKAATSQLDKVQDLFLSEIKDARAGERSAREAVLNERDGRHTAEVAFAEAEAEHKAATESIFDAYAKDPQKIAALFLLAKKAAGWLVTAKDSGVVKALTDGAK
jgi:exoribonuclease R